MRARVALVALLMACAAIAACRSRGAPSAEPAPKALDGVEIAACAAIDEGPVCFVRADRVVHLRAPASARDVRVVGGAASPIDAKDAALLAVRVDDGASAIAIEATVDGAPARWSMRVADERAQPAALIEARALRQAGKMDEAMARLADAGDAPEVKGAIARLDIVRGDLREAVRLFGESSEAHAAAGHLSRAADDALARAYLLQQELRRFGEARASLARAAAWSKDYAEGRIEGAIFEGGLARDLGDLREALRRLGDAERLATRLGVTSLAMDAAHDRALVWDEAGLFDEALRELAPITTSPDAAPCTRADAWLNSGWMRLAKNEARTPGVAREDAHAPLARAIAILTDECKDARREENARTNLAWDALQRGALDEARAELARARATMREPSRRVSTFWIDLEGQIALAEGRPQAAREAYERLAATGRATGAADDAWRGADGRAEALAAMGKTREALAATEEAERWLASASRGVAIDEGRASFVGARDRSARRRVELLLAAGDPARALGAARAAHAAALADVERRDRVAALDPEGRAKWEAALVAFRAARDALAADAALDATRSTEAQARAAEARRAREDEQRAALEAMTASLPRRDAPAFARPAPDSGARLVAFFPLLREWVAFVDDGRRVIVARLGAIDPRADDATLGRALLDPLRDALAGATRVTLVVHGALGDVDVHALPLDGAPLVARASVEYALDLGGAAADAPSRAAIVADPTSDLPSARREARAAVAALGDAAVLEGASATRAAVLRAIDGASYVHYAGHGVFDGVEGWSSALALADGPLAVRDLFALARAPRAVVLSGCETARSAVADRAVGIGIAHAFLAAGSDVAIGAVRAVDDEATRDLFAAFYDALAADPARDPVAALRRAQVATMARRPRAAWSAFRAVRR